MLKRTKGYSEWRLEKLSDPERAARYLNAAKKDSKEAFLHALKNVIQAREVTKVAKEAGVSRESVYRSFSAEGNPTYDTFSSILEALDIDYVFRAKDHAGSGAPSSGSTETIHPATRSSNTKIYGTGGSVSETLPVSTMNGILNAIKSGSVGNASAVTLIAVRDYVNVSNNGVAFYIPSLCSGSTPFPAQYMSATLPTRNYGTDQENARSGANAI
jgi:probable addiction module antidote protein